MASRLTVRRLSGLTPRLVRLVATALALLVTMFAHGRAHAADRALASAQRRAAQLDLASRKAWARLLHYRPTLFGGVESQIDGSEFFLSAEGKTNPHAELVATVRGLFAPVAAGREGAHTRCRFPARAEWLMRQLDLTGSLPPIRCSALDRFYRSLEPGRVSLVYASNALEYPASAFGHTFLQIEPRSGPGFGVDYQADTDTKNPILYAFKGITGLFVGRFGVHAVAKKRSEYADDEDRDLWEYQLALRDEETRLLVLHLWELAATRIDYFYFTENCSYHILGLLEAAAPRLELTNQLKFVVMPADSVRAALDAPGLVSSVRFYPSLNRRQVSAASGVSITPPWIKRPERGHGTMRVTLGSGTTTRYDDAFYQLGYRLALHDLADPPSGHPELAQVQFLDTVVRYSVTNRRLTLQRLTFAELIALHPLSRFEDRLSWRAGAYGRRVHDDGCEGRDCFAHGWSASVGAALATTDEALTVFAMADVHMLFSAGLSGIGGSFVRAGVGPFAGARLRLGAETVLLVAGTWSYLPVQEPFHTFQVTTRLRQALGRHVAVGLEAELQPEIIEGSLSSFFYF